MGDGLEIARAINQLGLAAALCGGAFALLALALDGQAPLDQEDQDEQR
jgi:hypothetical protein